MAIAHVQTPAGGAANSSATSLNLAFAGNVTAANMIAVSWRYSGGGLTVTLSDTLTNTYVSNAIESIDTADGNSTCGIGYALNIAGGACTVTFAISGGANKNLRVSVSEFSGVATSGALDKTAAANGTSNAPAAGSVTPTTDGQLFFCGCHHSATIGADYTAGTDFTINTTVVTTTQLQRLATERYVQPTAAAHNGNYSLPTSSNSWGCVLATFSPTSIGGAAGQPTVKRMGGVPYAHRLGGAQGGAAQLWREVERAADEVRRYGRRAIPQGA